jgi:hypothetical protein
MTIYKKNAMVVRFTPEMAKIYLSFLYKYQRNLRKDHVTFLASEMKRGNFTDSKIDVGVLDGAERMLLNGQHTLNAIIESGVTLDLSVIEHYAQNEEDLKRLYETFDTQHRRTYVDSMRVYELANELGMTETAVSDLGAALVWARCNFGIDKQVRNSITFQDRRNWSRFWKWEMNAVLDAIKPCERNVRTTILKQSVLSVALITMRYQPEKAFSFWRQVAWQDGLKQYDPRQTILRYLLTTVRSHQYDIEKTRAPDISRAVALAWNAYMEKRVWRYVLIRDRGKLMTLSGTPYNGNQSSNYLPLVESPNKNRAISSLWVPGVPFAPES